MTPYEKLFLASQYIAPQRLISYLYGVAAQCRHEPAKNWMIDTFIRRYSVDMSLAQQPDPHSYEHFNAFFTRALRADARPLDSTPDSALCPADGIVSQAGEIDEGRIFQAKGHHYTSIDLLGGCPMRAQPFQGGSFATVYLAPKDYHRVHMPVGGTLREMIHVPGRLFSVNPLTARNVPALFARNERVACLFDTDYGPMAVVLVGAMIVAWIETVWEGLVAPQNAGVSRTRYGDHAAVKLEKGAEMGRFKLGSTVVVLFGPGHAQWRENLAEGTPVNMGEGIASLRRLPSPLDSDNGLPTTG